MGYAIFAARKIMLNTRIMNINFRMMCLSQQQQSLADQSGLLQQCFNSLGMQLNATMQDPNALKLMQSGFAANGYNVGQTADQAGNMYGMNGIYYGMMQELNAKQQALLYPINQAEQKISNEMKRLETQLKAAQSELEQVEKAEGDAIKNSAPKFA